MIALVILKVVGHLIGFYYHSLLIFLHLMTCVIIKFSALFDGIHQLISCALLIVVGHARSINVLSMRFERYDRMAI